MLVNNIVFNFLKLRSFLCIVIFTVQIASKYAAREKGLAADDILVGIPGTPYMKQHLVVQEFTILQTIEWKLCAPTVCNFLPRFIAATSYSFDLYFFRVVHCLCERVYLDYNLLRYPPSLLAASVIKLAHVLKSLGPGEISPIQSSWSYTLEMCTGYKEHQLESCIHAIQQSLWAEVAQRHNVLGALNPPAESKDANVGAAAFFIMVAFFVHVEIS